METGGEKVRNRTTEAVVVAILLMVGLPVLFSYIGLLAAPYLHLFFRFTLWVVGFVAAIGGIAWPLTRYDGSAKGLEGILCLAVVGGMILMCVSKHLTQLYLPLQVRHVSSDEEALNAVDEGATHLILSDPIALTEYMDQYTDAYTYKKEIGSEKRETQFFLCPIAPSSSHREPPFAIWVSRDYAQDSSEFYEMLDTESNTVRVTLRGGGLTRSRARNSKVAAERVLAVTIVESFEADSWSLRFRPGMIVGGVVLLFLTGVAISVRKCPLKFE